MIFTLTFRCASISCKAVENSNLGYSMEDESYSAGDEAVILCQPGHTLYQQEPMICDQTGKNYIHGCKRTCNPISFWEIPTRRKFN